MKLRDVDETRMIAFVDLVNDDGDEEAIEVHICFDVCDTCEGRGKYVNPAIDGHGISQDEFRDDPDFEEAYFAGRYDITCTECKGLRVVPIADPARNPSELIERFEEIAHEDAQYDAIAEAERRFGA